MEHRAISKLTEVFTTLRKRHISVHAANASYFMILAVFPALVLLMSVLRYLPLDVHSLIAMLEGLVPEALLPAAEKLVLNTYQSTSMTMVSVSAVAALWSASRGIYGLLTGLNVVYGVSESRGYFYTRFISVVYTFVFLVLLVLTLGLHVFGTTVLELLENARSPFLRFLTDVIDLRFFLLVFLQTAVFTTMFMALPNRKNSLGESLPGALLSSIGWLVFSHIYSLYIDHFPSYSGIYGSVYGIAFCMLWLYCCVSIVFYGGALNFFLKEEKKG